MFKRLLHFVMCLAMAAAAHADPVLSEDFDDPLLEGWAALNLGTPGGTTSWFLGNPGVFPAHQGADDSYAAANFLAAGAGGDIDLWLLTPVLDFSIGRGLQLSFFTRANGALPDRLEIWAGLGDDIFGYSRLLSINPLLGNDYPTDWTEFEAIFASAGSGRFAFRYYVTDTFSNGDYIGIDTIRVTQVPEPASLALLAVGLILLAFARRRRKLVRP